MATAHDSGLILISVEYTTRCYVDFGRTERTFICFGAHSNLEVLLLGYDDYNYCTYTHSPCIYTCNYTPMAMTHDSGLIDIDFGGIYDTLLC